MHGESHATKVFVYQWCVNALIVNGLGNDLRNYVCQFHSLETGSAGPREVFWPLLGQHSLPEAPYCEAGVFKTSSDRHFLLHLSLCKSTAKAYSAHNALHNSERLHHVYICRPVTNGPGGQCPGR